jgi:hypothetical protein
MMPPARVDHDKKKICATGKTQEQERAQQYLPRGKGLL